MSRSTTARGSRGPTLAAPVTHPDVPGPRCPGPGAAPRLCRSRRGVLGLTHVSWAHSHPHGMAAQSATWPPALEAHPAGTRPPCARVGLASPFWARRSLGSGRPARSLHLTPCPEDPARGTGDTEPAWEGPGREQGPGRKSLSIPGPRWVPSSSHGARTEEPRGRRQAGTHARLLRAAGDEAGTSARGCSRQARSVPERRPLWSPAGAALVALASHDAPSLRNPRLTRTPAQSCLPPSTQGTGGARGGGRVPMRGPPRTGVSTSHTHSERARARGAGPAPTLARHPQGFPDTPGPRAGAGEPGRPAPHVCGRGPVLWGCRQGEGVRDAAPALCQKIQFFIKLFYL